MTKQTNLVIDQVIDEQTIASAFIAWREESKVATEKVQAVILAALDDGWSRNDIVIVAVTLASIAEQTARNLVSSVAVKNGHRARKSR